MKYGVQKQPIARQYHFRHYIKRIYQITGYYGEDLNKYKVYSSHAAILRGCALDPRVLYCYSAS